MANGEAGVHGLIALWIAVLGFKPGGENAIIPDLHMEVRFVKVKLLK